MRAAEEAHETCASASKFDPLDVSPALNSLDEFDGDISAGIVYNTKLTDPSKSGKIYQTVTYTSSDYSGQKATTKMTCFKSTCHNSHKTHKSSSEKAALRSLVKNAHAEIDAASSNANEEVVQEASWDLVTLMKGGGANTKCCLRCRFPSTSSASTELR
ncbi:hypothetical protein CYMTET_35868 [Cymbomonas tetramitiformis]|uniref:Uncharacterized protein n=2 Tax=Cymbomonas tetramitiformis TaxID=36881 RepID=A0AAE0F8D8_9CHLO|nr:hypothetical protein CYMTET_35868 [Cymbomonas tetramitiformis]